jgi:hypothetical protein
MVIVSKYELVKKSSGVFLFDVKKWYPFPVVEKRLGLLAAGNKACE